MSNVKKQKYVALIIDVLWKIYRFFSLRVTSFEFFKRGFL